MDINELESFKLSDAVAFHKELNPKLWEDNKLDPEVRDQLLLIAEDFVEYLGLSNLKVKDVTISGSNAAYSYTPHSDLDLHILVDFNELPENEVYQELFTAKKTLYNDAHDITVHDVPVELYVQDINQPVQSLGEYSIVHDKWIRIPKKRRANFDEVATKAKYEKLGDLIELALKSKDPKRVKDTIDLVKRYRKSGLDKAGEFGPENLAYKAVRKQGLVQALYDLKSELHAEKLSIEEAASRDDALVKIKKLLQTSGRTSAEKDNIKRIVAKMMQQWNIDPSEIGVRQPVDPLKAKIAKAAYEKTMAADKFKQEWERFKKGIFAEDDVEEDYDPNGPPPGPEFKPTMPAGTVKVDVSDVYDWYKLGQHISNMKGLGKHDFGKGPPSTILSFGDEDTEHKYIQDLEKTGLTTTDIDPIDPNQPKGMKRQKTDPTFKVDEAETTNRKAAVLKIQKHLNKKYGANLDLDGKLGPLTLRSINKFMPKAKTGLADEPNKTTAVQGKKLKEADKTSGITFTQEPYEGWNGMGAMITAYADGNQVGQVIFEPTDNDKNKWYATEVEVEDEFQRRGIATTMYDMAKKIAQKANAVIVPSHAQTSDAKGLWKNKKVWEASDYSQYENKIENFVQSLNPDDVGVEEIGPYHVHFEGFTDECQQDAQRRCNLPSDNPRHLANYDDVYKEVIRDFVRREDGKKPLKVGFAGYQDYPVIYAVFDNPEPYKNPDAWNPKIDEASGYIPSAKEKNDPRFKTALTVDVKPDSIKKNAKAYNWKTSRAGIPPQARADGKIAEDLMKEWNSFLAEDQEQQELFPGYDKKHREERLNKWLGKSHAMAGKKPQVLYHATTKDFDQFRVQNQGWVSGDFFGNTQVDRTGIFLAQNPKFAEEFIKNNGTGPEWKENAKIIPVYLSAQYPFSLLDDSLSPMLSDEATVQEFKDNDIDLWSIYRYFNEDKRWELFDGPEGEEFVRNLKKLGYDSAVMREEAHSHGGSEVVWVAFDPAQVKAITNRGSFSPDDPRMMKENG
jgi:predicted GNAT family acetyltransferase